MGETNPKPSPFRTRKWITADGTEIRVCDMSDTHLLNAIRYVEREGMPGGCGYVSPDGKDVDYDPPDDSIVDVMRDEAAYRGLTCGTVIPDPSVRKDG